MNKGKIKIAYALIMLAIAAANALKAEDKFLTDTIETATKDFSNIVNVSDYGAIANDGIDDTQSIRRAISDNAKTPNTKIVFEKGVYNVNPKGGCAAEIRGAKNFMLDGRGATILSGSKGGIFPISASENVVVANFNFDTEELPYAVVKVVSADGEFFCGEIQDGYKYKHSPVRAITAYDPSTNTLAKGFDLYQLQNKIPAESVGKNMIKVNAHRTPQVGGYVVLRYEVYGEGVVRIGGSKNVRLRNLKLYSHPGMGIYAGNSENIALENIYVGIPEDSNRAMSITADATHFNVCRGNIYILNSSFSRMGDDATNVHQMYWLLAEKPSGKNVKLKFGRKGGFWPECAPRVSDTIEFGAQDNWLKPEDAAKVVSMKVDTEKRLLHIELDKPIPEDTAVNTPVSIAEANTKLVIKNCESFGNRARGFLIQTRKSALVENCTFKDNTMMPILIENDNNYWFEGAGTSNLTIRNCKFVNSNTWGHSTAAILARATISAGTPKCGGVHENIKIQNCTFENCGTNPVQLNDTENIELLDNIIK